MTNEMLTKLAGNEHSLSAALITLVVVASNAVMVVLDLWLKLFMSHTNIYIYILVKNCLGLMSEKDGKSDRGGDGDRGSGCVCDRQCDAVLHSPMILGALGLLFPLLSVVVHSI